MSHEGLKTQTPEQSQASSEVIAQAFATAQDDLRTLTFDKDFHKDLDTHGMPDPFDAIGTPRYLAVLADYSRTHLDTLINSDLKVDRLRLHTLKLMASVPTFLHAKYALDSGAKLNPVQVHSARLKVSRFNGQVAEFVTAYPQARVEDVSKALLGSVNATVENKRVREASFGMLSRTLFGIRHELAQGQLLKHLQETTGRQFRTTTIQEDLEGADYIVQGDRVPTLILDVKGSSNQASQSSNYNGYYAIDRGAIRLRSLLSEQDFRGKFFVPEQVAAARAPQLDHILKLAELEMVNPNEFRSLTQAR